MLLRCQGVGDVDGEVSVETVVLLRKFKRATVMNFVLAGGERVHEDEVSIAGRSGGATRLRRRLRRPGVRHRFEDPIGTRRKEIDLWIDEPKRARPGKTGTVNLEEKVHNVVREVRRVRKLARCVLDVRTDRGAGGLQAGPFRVE